MRQNEFRKSEPPQNGATGCTQHGKQPSARSERIKIIAERCRAGQNPLILSACTPSSRLRSLSTLVPALRWPYRRAKVLSSYSELLLDDYTNLHTSGMQLSGERGLVTMKRSYTAEACTICSPEEIAPEVDACSVILPGPADSHVATSQTEIQDLQSYLEETLYDPIREAQKYLDSSKQL